MTKGATDRSMWSVGKGFKTYGNGVTRDPISNPKPPTKRTPGSQECLKEESRQKAKVEGMLHNSSF